MFFFCTFEYVTPGDIVFNAHDEYVKPWSDIGLSLAQVQAGVLKRIPGHHVGVVGHHCECLTGCRLIAVSVASFTVTTTDTTRTGVPWSYTTLST